jgi:hypothetical protein
MEKNSGGRCDQSGQKWSKGGPGMAAYDYHTWWGPAELSLFLSPGFAMPTISEEIQRPRSRILASGGDRIRRRLYLYNIRAFNDTEYTAYAEQI